MSTPSIVVVAAICPVMPRSEAVASQATSKPEAKSGEMKEETRALPEYPVGRWVSQDNPRASAAATRTAMAAMSLRTGRGRRRDGCGHRTLLIGPGAGVRPTMWSPEEGVRPSKRLYHGDVSGDMRATTRSSKRTLLDETRRALPPGDTSVLELVSVLAGCFPVASCNRRVNEKRCVVIL